MPLNHLKLTYQDTLEVFTTGITLETSHPLMPSEKMTELPSKLSQDSQFSVNGKLIGHKDIVSLLDIIYSMKTQEDSSSTTHLTLTSKTLLQRTTLSK